MVLGKGLLRSEQGVGLASGRQGVAVVFINLEGRVAESVRRACSFAVESPNASSSQDWARSKLGARNAFWTPTWVAGAPVLSPPVHWQGAAAEAEQLGLEPVLQKGVQTSKQPLYLPQGCF